MNQKNLILLSIIFFIVATSVGYLIYQNQSKPTPLPQLTSQPLPTKTPATIDNYCSYKTNYSRTTSVADCGDFKVLRQNCCDIPDIILDRNGNKIMDCGGLKGYSEECTKRFLPQTNCIDTQCKNN